MTDADPEFSWQKMFVAAASALDDVSTRISAGLAQVANHRRNVDWSPTPRLWGASGAPRFQEATTKEVPGGWQLLEIGQGLDVIDLMARTDWCLTMSPRADTPPLLACLGGLRRIGRVAMLSACFYLAELSLRHPATGEENRALRADRYTDGGGSSRKP